MPTGYVKKLAKKHHTTVGKSEDKWSKAKAVAANQGKPKNFAYITSIYKKMMGESARELSFIDFLHITESDDVSDMSYGSRDDEFPDEDDQFDDDEFQDDDEFADDSDSGVLVDVLGPDELEDEDDQFDDEYPDDDRDEFADEDDLEFDDEYPDKDRDAYTDEDSGYGEDRSSEKGIELRDRLSGVSESFLSSILEKWAHEADVPKSKKGMFKGRTKASLEAELAKLKKSGPHRKGSAEYTKEKELMFALRAKSDWGKV